MNSSLYTREEDGFRCDRCGYFYPFDRTDGTPPDQCENCLEKIEAIDKSTWGPGPWQDEPDRIEFEHAGVPCLMVRHDRGGHWCGYAAVPPGHPLHGEPYDKPDVEVHGGLTYSDKCRGDICHVPAPGEPDNVWWFGFDCAHAGDFAPGYEATMLSIQAIMELRRTKYPNLIRHEVYRDMHYVRSETEKLAEQLAKQ